MLSRFRVSGHLASFRKRRALESRKNREPLHFEFLEPRCLLAATDLGAISGRAFVDLDVDTVYDAGEELAGAAIQLFLDNGTTPGVFDAGDTEQGALGSPDTTDANGLYRFDGLPTGTYFVVQPLQILGSRTLDQQVSGPISVSGTGTTGTVAVDSFATNQSLFQDIAVDATPVAAFHVVGDALGGERDVAVDLQSAGAASAQVLNNELLLGLSGGGTADFTVVYDGIDGSTTVDTSGLAADLTDGDTNTHFSVTINSQVGGDNATITVQNATMTATESFVLSAGETTYCLAFADFTGDTAVFQNVGAITLAINGAVADNDFEVSNFGTLQPAVQTQNFLNDAAADLRLTKTVDNSLPILGQNVNFTITLNNDGPDTATNVDIRDQLPAGLSFVTSTPSQGTYDSGTGIWSVGSVANGADATLQITATVSSTGAITNIAQVSASDQDDPDSLPDNNVSTEDDQDDATVTVQQADLSLTKIVDNASPNVGDDVTFTVTVANAGPNVATNVQVSDPLPAGLSFVSSTPSQGTYNSGTGTWTVGNIAVSGSQTLQITATVNNTTGITNVAQVSAADQDDPDSTPNNDVGAEDDQDDVTVTAQQADLSLTKTVNNASPNIDENVTFTVTVTNGGPDVATNVQVSDQLPAGLSFVSSTPSQGTYNSGTGIWSVGSITVSGNQTLQITATVTTTAGVTNVAQVSASDQFDPDSTPDNDILAEDDQDDASLAAQQADLRLIKTVDNSTPNVGENVTFSVTVTNDGPNTATNVQVRDQLPAGLSFVSDSPTQGTYNAASGIWSVGTINSSTSQTLQITATVNTTAGVTNVAQVSASDQFDPDSTPDNDILAEDDQDDASLAAQQADLRLIKTVDNSTPNVGENVTFSVTVTNDGPNTATNVQVRDQLPAGLSFVSDSPTQGTYNAASGIWSVGTINSSTSQTLQITATVNTTAGVTNVAQVSASDQFDPDSTPDNDILAEDDQDDASLAAQQADLRLAKTVNNSTPNVGENVTFSVTVTNDGPNTATNVQVRDQLPAGLSFVSDSPSQGTYNAATGIWSVGTINSSTSQTLQITATVNTTAGVTNVAQVSASDQFDPDSTPDNDILAEDDQDDASLAAQQADLRLAKTVNNSTPNVGENVTFTVTVTNDGPNTATNVQVRDQLPAGLSFVSDSPSQGTYNATSGIWTVGTLNSSTSQTLQITATVNTAAGITNVAQVSASDQFDPDSTPDNNVSAEDDQDDATLTGQQADLRLTKSVSNSSPNLGDNVTFTINVTNDGPSTATNVQVRDQLPAGLSFVSDTPSQGNYNSGTGIWSIGTMNSGDTETLLITATVNSAAAITNAAQVSDSDQPDPDSTPDNDVLAEDDQDDASLAAQQADLRLSKSVNDNTPNLGQNVTFTVTVTNDGPNTATNVQIRDQLPGGLSYVSDTPSQGNYNSGTGIWSVGTIPSSNSETLQITATVNTTAGITNVAQVSASDQFDPDSTPDNNVPTEDDQDDASLTAQQADLSLNKTVNTSNPNFGDNVTFTVTLTNNGPNTATNVQVSDSLPAGLSFFSANESQGSYDNGTGIWTVGDLLDGDSETLQITATVNTASAVTNTAQVSAADQFDPDSTPNNNVAAEDDQDDASLATQVADLSVNKIVNDATPNLSENFIYTVTVTNNGPNTASDVEVEDVLPTGVSFVSSNASQGNYNSGSGIWTVGTLTDGATANLNITAQVTTPGTKTNLAQVSSVDQSDPDSTPGNSVASEDDQDSASLTPVALSSISGRVFFDADNDGVFDSTDTPIRGVSVTLSGPINRTIVTGLDGRYVFEDLVAGDYTVQEQQPFPFEDGLEQLGGDGLGSLSGNDEFFFSLGVGDNAQNYNFGESALSVSKTNFFASTADHDD